MKASERISSLEKENEQLKILVRNNDSIPSLPSKKDKEDVKMKELLDLFTTLSLAAKYSILRKMMGSGYTEQMIDELIASAHQSAARALIHEAYEKDPMPKDYLDSFLEAFECFCKDTGMLNWRPNDYVGGTR